MPTLILIVQLTGFASIQPDSAFQCIVTGKAGQALLDGDPIRARASVYMKEMSTSGGDVIEFTEPIGKALRIDGAGRVLNRYVRYGDYEFAYFVVEAELFNGSKAQQLFETCLRDVGFPRNTKILYYAEEERRYLPSASPVIFPKSEDEIQRRRTAMMKRKSQQTPLLLARLVYTGGLMAFLFHPPFLFYLGRRRKRKIPYPLICIISIFAGWFLINFHLRCQDIYLESAIFNGATEKSHYYFADGAREMFTALFGWIHSLVLLLIWAPILIICRFIYIKLWNKTSDITLSTSK